MELAFGIALLASTFIPIVMIGRWILGPIDRAAKFREAPVRFSIGDFLCLFLAVQIPLAVIYQLVDEGERPLFWLFTTITWVLAPFIWFACARALSKAGVIESKHRIVFLGLVMPLVYYALVPFVILTIAGVSTLVTGRSFDVRYIGWYIAAWLALLGIFYVSGLFTRKIVTQAQPIQSSDDVDSSDPTEPPVSELQRRLQAARAAMSRHGETSTPVKMPNEM